MSEPPLVEIPNPADTEEASRVEARSVTSFMVGGFDLLRYELSSIVRIAVVESVCGEQWVERVTVVMRQNVPRLSTSGGRAVRDQPLPSLMQLCLRLKFDVGILSYSTGQICADGTSEIRHRILLFPSHILHLGQESELVLSTTILTHTLQSIGPATHELSYTEQRKQRAVPCVVRTRASRQDEIGREGALAEASYWTCPCERE